MTENTIYFPSNQVHALINNYQLAFIVKQMMKLDKDQKSILKNTRKELRNLKCSEETLQKLEAILRRHATDSTNKKYVDEMSGAANAMFFEILYKAKKRANRKRVEFVIEEIEREKVTKLYTKMKEAFLRQN